MFFIKNNVIYTMMLVIQGENDKYATLAQVDAIARRAGAGAEVMVLPDCGHSPHTEQKATTLKVMADFILSILHQLVYVVIKQTKKGYMMLVKEILNSTRPALSFEFFPPKTEAGFDKIFQAVSDLMQLKPSYASVTYGAGGSTRDYTANLVVRIQKETGLTVVSHLTCVGSTRDEIMSILEKSAESGIENILALRGDPPKGETVWKRPENGFDYAADLVSFINKNYPHICIGVAGFPEGHPLTPNRLKEMEYLKAKVDAGADYIVTQLFFDNRDFYDFCERCELAGIHVPVIAGVMPITTRKGMIRMAQLAEGTRFPAGLLRSVARAENDEYFEEICVRWAAEQLRNLVYNNVRGIHLYTLNSSRAIFKIFKLLGVRDATQF